MDTCRQESAAEVPLSGDSIDQHDESCCDDAMCSIPFDINCYLFYVELFCLTCSDAGARYILNDASRVAQVQRWLLLPSLCPIRESILAAISCSTRSVQFMRALVSGGWYALLCEQLLPVLLKFHHDLNTCDSRPNSGVSLGPRMPLLWDTFWQSQIAASMERLIGSKMLACVEYYLSHGTCLKSFLSETRYVCAGMLPSIWASASNYPNEVEMLNLRSMRVTRSNCRRVSSTVCEHSVFHVLKALVRCCASGPVWRPIDSRLVSVLLEFFFTPIPSVNLLPIFSVLVALIESNKASVHSLLIERMPSRLLAAFTDHTFRSIEAAVKLPGQQRWRTEFDAVYASLCKQLFDQGQYLLEALKPMSLLERQRVEIELLHLSSHMHMLRVWFNPNKPQARLLNLDFDTEDQEEKRRLSLLTCLAMHYLVSNRNSDVTAAQDGETMNEFYYKTRAVERIYRERPVCISSAAFSFQTATQERVGVDINWPSTELDADDCSEKFAGPPVPDEFRGVTTMNTLSLPRHLSKRWAERPDKEQIQLASALVDWASRFTWPPPWGLFNVKITFADGYSSRKYDMRLLQMESNYFDRLLHRQYLKASGDRTQPVTSHAFNVRLDNVDQKAFDAVYMHLHFLDDYQMGMDKWRLPDDVPMGHVLFIADQFLFHRFERWLCHRMLTSTRVDFDDMYELVWAGVTMNSVLPAQIGLFRSFRQPFRSRQDYDSFISLCELAMSSTECRRYMARLVWLDMDPMQTTCLLKSCW